MPQTPKGITYPDSSGHTRLWEHFQALAEDADALHDKPLGKARQVTAQTFPHNTTTNITYDTTDFLRHGVTRTASGLVVPKAGVYRVTVSIALNSTAGLLMVSVTKNGANQQILARGPSSPAAPTLLSGSTLLELAAGDTVGGQVFHTHGSDRTTFGGTYVTGISVEFVEE